ncbi:unnamed protein product [Phyllotreta striolata]|uniref:Pyridoxal-dependent decarboxylase domain-containing protein 1 n=1 Tax=Phyllotreta striolata TaxID=444603 RepID=A0A9N9XTP2_PHYSR|nr:unnamed protein product [Phyllotreta striolata]
MTTSTKNNLGELAIEASEIVSRLEQIAEGIPVNENSQAQTTVFLGLEKRHTDEIVKTIHDLLNSDEEGEPFNFPSLDSVTKLVMISHTLSVYCGTLERPTLQKLSTRFTTDTTRWITQLFGLLDCHAFYHEDNLEGLVRVTKMMLHSKFPRYSEDGALVFTNSLPTIYNSVASPLGSVQYLCRQLGLPLDCIRPVPTNTYFGSQYTMDVSALQKVISDDIADGRVPLIVIADAGTPVTGHIDSISRIKELCKVHDLWLHLRGHSLSALTLANYQQRNGPVPPLSDSLTLTLGSWLGIPGLPNITLYRLWESLNNSARSKQVGVSRESTLPFLAGLNTDHQSKRILSLPLWAGLQSLGTEGVHSRIREDFLASERLWVALDRFRQIRVLSPKPGGESGTYTVTELVSKPTTVSVLLESVVCSVVFQFIPETPDDDYKSKVPTYYDKLNSWLGQILQLDAPQVPIDICELDNIGVVLRFCPFENTSGQQPTSDDIQNFIACLEQQLVILKATVHHRESFVKLVEVSPVLKVVDLPDWAGLGGVRYCPEGWEQLLTDQAKDELNHLNMVLVDTLRETDAAFSLGEGVDGLMCVRFGMLTPESDVDKLLELVVRVGQSVEENSKVLDSMSEIVKKGIETATLDLQKENEERLWQEGIVRHIPIVGTFVNWWSPKQKETGGIRGRSLNLTQGVVESTENIYKYHMQMGQGVATGGVTPPAPQIQKSIGHSHSRSSSHASASSQQSNVKIDGELFKLNLENDVDKINKEMTVENDVITTS